MKNSKIVPKYGINKSILLLSLFMNGIALADGSIHRINCDEKRAVIFDIDDKLVDTFYRTLHILLKAGKELHLNALIELEYPKVDFFCSVTVKNAGIKDPALLEKICGHFDPDPRKNTMYQSVWGKSFYSDPEELHFDHVMAGAPDFVNRIMKETDAKIIYVTGRSEEQQTQGTIEELAYYGFPGFNGDQSACASLVMKPQSYLGDDTSFKKAITIALQQTGVTILAAFDDSASNANMFRDIFPAKVLVVRPNRNVADTAKNRPGIEQITNYYLNATVDAKTGVRSVSSNEDQLTDMIQRAIRIDTDGSLI